MISLRDDRVRPILTTGVTLGLAVGVCSLAVFGPLGSADADADAGAEAMNDSSFLSPTSLLKRSTCLLRFSTVSLSLRSVCTVTANAQRIATRCNA